MFICLDIELLDWGKKLFLIYLGVFQITKLRFFVVSREYKPHLNILFKKTIHHT